MREMADHKEGRKGYVDLLKATLILSGGPVGTSSPHFPGSDCMPLDTPSSREQSLREMEERTEEEERKREEKSK